MLNLDRSLLFINIVSLMEKNTIVIATLTFKSLLPALNFWTGEQIAHQPFIVYECKVKPMIS
jgi:hypothetical protein